MSSDFTVLITGPPIAASAMERLQRRCKVIDLKPYSEPSELAALAARYQTDALIVRMGKINAEVISASSKLKVIAKHGTGVDNIDVAEAGRRGIVVTITSTANYESVAEHAFGLLLAAARGTVYLDGRIRQGFWDKAAFRGMELCEKTLGIIGFGRIGRRLAELVQPLRMPVLAFDPYITPSEIPDTAIHKTKLEDLLRNSDFACVCCPLTPETTHLITARELRWMRPTALLINTARGGIVDEQALADALSGGTLAGAAIDVYGKEPIDPYSPLLKAPNIVLTPHIGGVTRESLDRMGMEVVENVLDVLSGKKPPARRIVSA